MIGHATGSGSVAGVSIEQAQELLKDAGLSGYEAKAYLALLAGGEPMNGYEVAKASFQDMERSYDPSLINAVVLLTDGVNDDGDESDDARQLQDLLSTLQRGTNGETAKPIRVFTIAYGKDADLDTLKRIAQASNAAAYDASNPATISKVFTAVLSNF